MNIRDAADITGGTLISSPAATADHGFSGVAIDSRCVNRKELFVPLPGTRTDGHRFIADAVRNGAGAVLVDESRWSEAHSSLETEGLLESAFFLLVNDPLTAMQQLARNRMMSLPRLKRIAVTGSSGKTTTKELLGGALKRRRKTYVSGGNYNSEIGVCLEAFTVPEDAEYAVFELGINRIGEMDILADIVRPDYGIITNIGEAHIGLLGSKENIAREKKRIFRFFDGAQVGFIPEETEYRDLLMRDVPGRIRTLGFSSFPGKLDVDDMGLEGSRIRTAFGEAILPLPGRHNVRNFLSAAAAALEVGTSFSDIASAAGAAAALFGRGEVLRGRSTVISDCYNANPDSMRQAIQFFEGLPTAGKKVLVLGAMKELGEYAEAVHRDLGRMLTGTDAEAVFLFGEEMEATYREAYEEMKGRLEWFTDFDELRTGVFAAVGKGDLVLLKGSRGLELERLIAGFGIQKEGLELC